MSNQLGKGFFKKHFTVSVQAGMKALEELFLQKHIPTTVWSRIIVGPIDNHGTYSDANRTMIFTLEDKRKVEIEVTTWKKKNDDNVSSDRNRKWSSYIVYVESGDRMKCFVNHIGNKPWYRQHEDDKPLIGIIWRIPTSGETAAYQTAVKARDEKKFIEVYYSDLIDWGKLNDKLRMNPRWFRETLKKFA